MEKEYGTLTVQFENSNTGSVYQFSCTLNTPIINMELFRETLLDFVNEYLEVQDEELARSLNAEDVITCRLLAP